MAVRKGSYSRVLYGSFQLYDESLRECLEFGTYSIRQKQAMIGNYCIGFDKSQELPVPTRTEGYYFRVDFESLRLAIDRAILVEVGFV